MELSAKEKKKAYMKEYMKDYYKKNRGKWEERNKKYHCEVCQKDISYINKASHEKTYSHQRKAAKLVEEKSLEERIEELVQLKLKERLAET